jgi:hypothetical protein
MQAKQKYENTVAVAVAVVVVVVVAWLMYATSVFKTTYWYMECLSYSQSSSDSFLGILLTIKYKIYIYEHHVYLWIQPLIQ